MRARQCEGRRMGDESKSSSSVSTICKTVSRNLKYLKGLTYTSRAHTILPNVTYRHNKNFNLFIY